MPNLSRAQVAARLNVSVRTLVRREASLGLAKVKVNIGPRLIRYPQNKVASVLRAHGLE